MIACRVPIGLAMALSVVGCQKNYINTHNGAPQHEVRVVHNCGNGGIAKVYFDREYAMKGHITATSHSVMRGYPLKIRLAAGNHRMIVEDANQIYSREFRVTGPMEIVSNCRSSR